MKNFEFFEIFDPFKKMAQVDIDQRLIVFQSFRIQLYSAVKNVIDF